MSGDTEEILFYIYIINLIKSNLHAFRLKEYNLEQNWIKFPELLIRFGYIQRRKQFPFDTFRHM